MARVDFKIIVPATLSLQMRHDALVSSNNRSVVFTGHSSGVPYIINAVHQQVIVQHLTCGDVVPSTLTCTVSTP